MRIRKLKKGAEDLTVAETLHNLAKLYDSKDEYDKAIVCYKESVRVKKLKLGEDHNSVADTLFNMGSSHEHNEKHESAVDCYEKVIRIRRLQNGESHESVALIANRLGKILSNKEVGKFEGAISLFHEALSIYDNHPEKNEALIMKLMNRLAATYDKNGDYNNSITHYRDLIRMKKKKLGDQHEDVANLFFVLGNVMAKTEDFNKAISYYKHALKLRQMNYGKNHLSVANTRVSGL